jgi:hypothetical protein
VGGRIKLLKISIDHGEGLITNHRSRGTFLWRSEIKLLTYLSTEMATSVKTLAATVTLATKLFTVQYMAPNGQSEFSMKMKLNMQFSKDIRRSETLRLTRK